MNLPPLFSILIVNYNGISHLEVCLNSLYSQNFTNFEVIVVDNNSTDKSCEFIKIKYPYVNLIISNINRGFAGGNNFGIPHCRGKFVFFLNNDTQLDPDCFRNLAENISNNPNNKVFACLLLNFHNPSKVDSAGDGIYWAGPVYSFTGYPVTHFNKPREISSACGAAAIYKREVLEEIGYFDDDFFLNFEDLDLSFRAQHAGYKIWFLPDVKVLHKGSATLDGKKSYLSIYYAERNYVLFLLKNFPTTTLIAFVPSYLFIKIARLIMVIRQRKIKAYFLGTLHGFILVPKILKKRKIIQINSKISNQEFNKLIRKHWILERISAKNGNFKLYSDP